MLPVGMTCCILCVWDCVRVHQVRLCCLGSGGVVCFFQVWSVVIFICWGSPGETVALGQGVLCVSFRCDLL